MSPTDVVLPARYAPVPFQHSATHRVVSAIPPLGEAGKGQHIFFVLAPIASDPENRFRLDPLEEPAVHVPTTATFPKTAVR